MRGARAFVVLTAFLLILGVCTLLLYLVVRSEVENDPFRAGSTIGKTLFLGVGFVALVQVLIIVPAQSAGSLAGEKERETYDLLLTTRLPAWKIVMGKLAAALAYALLLVVAVVPLMALAFFFGGVTPGELGIALTGLLATAVLYGSMGIFWSAVAQRTMFATVMTQATSAVITLGVPFVAVIFSLLVLSDGSPPGWVESYPFVYLAGAVLATHPFIALGASEALFSDGNNRLFFPVTDNNIWIPQPWLAFVIMAALLSLVFIALATRSIRRARSLQR